MSTIAELLVTDRTRSDLLARNAKGTYNAEDLNRVGRVSAYLAGVLNGYGYQVAVPGKDLLPAYLIEVQVTPPRCGTAAGGVYFDGEEAVLKAVPAEECDFIRWSENGQTVSQERHYTFSVDRSRHLKAEFETDSLFTGFVPEGETEPMKAADGQTFFCTR